MPSADLLTHLGARRNGDGWMARCPAHADDKASLAVNRGADGRWLLHCHAGCDIAKVLLGANLTMADLQPEASTPRRIVAEYSYVDANGNELYQVVRFEPKDFRQRRRDPVTQQWTWNLHGVERVLYRLPDLKGREAVFLTEGEKDADALVALGLPATTSPQGAGKWRADYAHQLVGAGVTCVCVLPDHDDAGRQHAAAVASSCHGAGLVVRILELPGLGPKQDVSDWLAAGGTTAQLSELARQAPAWPPAEPAPSEPAGAAATVEPRTLDDVHRAFRRWLGADYDLDVIDVVLATAAVERMDGDPLWVLIVGGPGAAKTETAQSLSGTPGAIITSTIASEGALLSGTPERSRSKTATGGLLRRLGATGALVVKDVTSILAMSREMRGAVLAAFREIHDGRWERNVGSDGGRSLTWAGRVVLIGAVTTAWDRAHEVIASLGDRFVLIRMDSTTRATRMRAGRQAIANTGEEPAMRADLAAVVAGVLSTIPRGSAGITLTTEEGDRLLAAANLVTLCRTAVDYDYRGDVIDANAPEMPTRFLRQLQQVVRGGVAIGLARRDALRLAVRCARDSMPPLRLAILEDVAAHPYASTSEVRTRLNKPRNTIDRQLQALHMLGVLDCDETSLGTKGSVWRYALVPDLSVDVVEGVKEERQEQETEETNAHTAPTDISGTSRDCHAPVFDGKPV